MTAALEKNQRKVEISLSSYDIEGPLDTLMERLESRIGGRICNDPELENDGWHRDEWTIVGWRPATEKELAQAKKRAEASKHANAMKKLKAEEYERAQYEKLKAKFGGV